MNDIEILEERTQTPDANESISARVHAIDWKSIEAGLSADGYAMLPVLLTAQECATTSALYAAEDKFRSRIVMERYAFGRGEYKYFSYPLPDVVQTLRSDLYAHLAPVANRWHEAMRLTPRFPPTHSEFAQRCHDAGQCRPTPLMLRYSAEDYCCLHQDLYGEHVFPFQVVFLLSQPGQDFEGGELLLTESDPKRAGRAQVLPLVQGQAVVFAVNSRPVASTRGFYRVSLRHGVSKLYSGSRTTMGIIFHDAK